MSASSPLPVLDLSGFRSDPDGPAGAAFVEALRDAFHGIGAAYLVGHGVSDDLVARVRQVAEEFFALPEAERLAIENVHSPQFRGYTRLGNEHTNGLRDLRDQIDIGRERPRPRSGPTIRPGCACAGRTCGRKGCRRSARPSASTTRRSRRSGTR